MADRKELPEIEESEATREAAETFWRDPRINTLTALLNARDDDMMTWVDANYERKVANPAETQAGEVEKDDGQLSGTNRSYEDMLL